MDSTTGFDSICRRKALYFDYYALGGREMVVYGEVLFLENAIIGALLLWMTKRICGEEVSKTKLLLGAVLCGLYAFTLFQREIPWLVSLMEKLMFSVVLIRLVFQKSRCWWKVLVFYGASFLLGGVTMGILGLCSVPSVACNGNLYLDHLTFLHLFSGILSTVLLFRLGISWFRERRLDWKTKHPVRILHAGKEITVQGYLDTGNCLMDPDTGFPVCLVSADLWEMLTEGKEPNRWISYWDATGEKGFLCVIEPDEFQIGPFGKQKRCKAVLAMGSTQREAVQWGGCPVLINGCFLEECMGLGG